MNFENSNLLKRVDRGWEAFRTLVGAMKVWSGTTMVTKALIRALSYTDSTIRIALNLGVGRLLLMSA
jgi:hypothetical protein